MMKLQTTGNVVVVGETGSGKTDVMVCAQRMIFAQSDVSQLRDLLAVRTPKDSLMLLAKTVMPGFSLNHLTLRGDK